MFADTPHLIKLLRTHTVQENCGVLVPNGRDGKALLSRGTFQELLNVDRGELRVAHKLTRLHIEVTILYDRNRFFKAAKRQPDSFFHALPYA